MVDFEFCISSYLAFRYVARANVGWASDCVPRFPDPKEQGQIAVSTSDEIEAHLRSSVAKLVSVGRVGVLLSAGIDSAILAAMLPAGSHAYTIHFEAPGSLSEWDGAKVFADRLQLKHTRVNVTWEQYLQAIPLLMKAKKSPLHAAEIGLFEASRRAAGDGVETLLVGNGADSTFGGMDKLLARDWTFDEFIDRYTFLEPAKAVRRPISVREIYDPYRRGDGVDVQRFLKEVHGRGIIQMFENAIHAGGCRIAAPFEDLALRVPLDLKRIRAGEPKYLLQSVFRSIYSQAKVPEKIPFARPMHLWLKTWSGPTRAEFVNDLDVMSLSGEQKWILFCLEQFLHGLDRGEF